LFIPEVKFALQKNAVSLPVNTYRPDVYRTVFSYIAVMQQKVRIHRPGTLESQLTVVSLATCRRTTGEDLYGINS
jgi:hypothetical protein